jgi:tRNA 2-thiouridine synthesizing protein E
MSDMLDLLCDDKGFLRDWQCWTAEIAEQFAHREHINLTDAHWEIITLLRRYYLEFDASPANRALVNYVKRHCGQDKGNSIYLLSLFPESPARRASRIAGLPKPKNCL